jgi:hypothetical protein
VFIAKFALVKDRMHLCTTQTLLKKTDSTKYLCQAEHRIKNNSKYEYLNLKFIDIYILDITKVEQTFFHSSNSQNPGFAEIQDCAYSSYYIK